jgi:hypothetical protein
MSETVTDLALIESWRQERAALKQKLERLQAGECQQRHLTVSQRLSGISQLRHTIAEYDAFIEEYRRDGCPRITFAPATPSAESQYQASRVAA